jgi:hypothetical protein
MRMGGVGGLSVSLASFPPSYTFFQCTEPTVVLLLWRGST